MILTTEGLVSFARSSWLKEEMSSDFFCLVAIPTIVKMAKTVMPSAIKKRFFVSVVNILFQIFYCVFWISLPKTARAKYIKGMSIIATIHLMTVWPTIKG